MESILALLSKTSEHYSTKGKMQHTAWQYSTAYGSLKRIRVVTRRISDEQLHTMELCIYHGIMVQVECLEGEHISQIAQCTGSQSWRGGDRWNACAWVKQHSGRFYGALSGHLPWQLQWLVKIKLLHEDGAFVAYWLALALTTIPENSRNLDPILKFVQVRNVPAAIAFQDFSMGNIIGYAQEIPEIVTSIKIWNRQNKQRIVKSRIDLATSNDVYN